MCVLGRGRLQQIQTGQASWHAARDRARDRERDAAEGTPGILQLLGKGKGQRKVKRKTGPQPKQPQQDRDRRAAGHPGPQPAPSTPPAVLGDLRQLWAKVRLGGLPPWTVL